MRIWDLRSAILLLLMSVMVCWESLKLSQGSLNNPGPGFFPFYLSLILGGLSLLLVFQALAQKKASAAKPLWAGKRWAKVVLCAAGLLIYSLLLDWIGFPIATTLLMMFFFRFIAPQKWYVVYLASIFIALFSYVIFKTWLGIQLPFLGALSF